MSALPARSASCWSGLDDSRCTQAFEQKPKTEDQFENGHGRIEPIVVNDLVEVGENEEDEGTDHAPGRRDQTEESQSFRDVVRLEPQPSANARGQSKKRQTDIIVIEIGGER